MPIGLVLGEVGGTHQGIPVEIYISVENLFFMFVKRPTIGINEQ